jgi:hypothetical protein
VGVRELDVGVGIGATLAGLAMLARVLHRTSPGSALPAIATAFVAYDRSSIELFVTQVIPELQ